MSAMSNRFRVSSTLPRKLEELGLSQSTVLRRAGLPIGLFKVERILVSTEQFFALHRGIADATTDPAIGLKLGAEERIERYDPVKLAALSARSFRDAVERSSRYKRLTCPEEIRLVTRGDECAVQFIWLLAQEQEPPLLVDACFAWIVSLSQRGTGRSLHPKRVEYQRALTHRAMYETHFRCPVKFKAKQNALLSIT
jgi:Arabinose-binding domain of AraC transcription regulator, N-term